jgi:hypothetical protein
LKKKKNSIIRSVKLVENLQILFSRLLLSKNKYTDPSDVIKGITNDDGEVIWTGDQSDVAEFMNCFLSRIGEGIS